MREATKSPLSLDQVARLLFATEGSTDPIRDTALLLFLLDTGCRAGETIALNAADVDLANGNCMVLGKGSKRRLVYFGGETAAALGRYLTYSRRLSTHGAVTDPESALFLPLHGRGRFTVSGLRCIVRRLSKAAGVKTSCSPHAFRRTFAVQTLRNGANVFSVQAMLGHTDLEMTRRYCRIAESDIETQHRAFGPVDNLLPSLSAP
jgi:site-specific recombinase XerD